MIAPRRAVTLVLLTTLLATGQGLAANRAAGLKVETTPQYVLAYCARSKWLRLACPHALPRMAQPKPHWETTVCVHGPTCLGTTWDDLELVDAGTGNKPPTWSHVSIQAGTNLDRDFPFVYPTHGEPPKRIDGLFAKNLSKGVFIGRYTWAGRTGTVILAPEFPTGGVQGGHLVFRWRHAGLEFAIGLHGWEPLSETLATLRAIVRSI